MKKIPLGVSQCLLGEPVRFDGGHKRNSFLLEVLSNYVEFQPVCPEVAIGLGIPRKPIRLIVTDGEDRIRGISNPDLDVTDALYGEAEKAVDPVAPREQGRHAQFVLANVKPWWVRALRPMARRCCALAALRLFAGLSPRCQCAFPVQCITAPVGVSNGGLKSEVQHPPTGMVPRCKPELRTDNFSLKNA